MDGKIERSLTRKIEKMKHKLFLSALALFAGLAMTSCSSDDDNFVLRSDSELRFGYAAGEKDFTICTQGEWTVSTESPWLSFDMMKGTGDGVTRQKIQVMSARNTGAARRDSFLIHAAGRDLTVYCDQEEGAPFTFGKGKLSGDLQVGKVSDLTIDLPFTYGYQGMSLTLHTALSGAGAQGLAVNDTTLTLDGERGAPSPSTKPTADAGNDLYGLLTTADGKGVAGVTVSDGYTCVQTDSRGFYQMKRHRNAQYVFYSTPAGYKARPNQFYQRLSATAQKYDPMWRVSVYEDGVYSGDMANSLMVTTSDAWATGLHLGVLNRNPKDFAPNSHHDFIYQLKNPEAKVIRVEAVDEEHQLCRP